jgi:WD40 repeat protein
MDWDEAVKAADYAVFSRTGEHLTDLQIRVMEKVWENQTYKSIAHAIGYSETYISQEVGPKLWNLLTRALDEKVTKKNFRAALERWWHYRQQTSLLQAPPQTSLSLEQPVPMPLAPVSVPASTPFPVRVDWGDLMVDVTGFCGRSEELCQLQQWLLEEEARLITLKGMAGVGKTVLARKLAEKMQSHFQFIWCRSLGYDRPLTHLLQDCLRFLSPDSEPPQEWNQQIAVLIEHLAHHRGLIILDDVQALFEPRQLAGRYRAGYELYLEWFRRMGTAGHRSCIVLISREQPGELPVWEGRRVRSLALGGLSSSETQRIFRQISPFLAEDDQWQAIVAHYGGNPLLLRMVATRIREVLRGDIQQFLDLLHQRRFSYDAVDHLICQQFDRLSPSEQEVMYWLAIAQYRLNFRDLEMALVSPESRRRLTETLASLQRRSLIEWADGQFHLLPVVQEYITEKFLQEVMDGLLADAIIPLVNHALLQAEAADYQRECQRRRILCPLVERLTRQFSPTELESRVRHWLELVRQRSRHAQGYAGGNLLNLGQALKLNFDGWNFANLSIWQAYLQDTTLLNADFSDTDLAASVFAKNLGSHLVTTFDPTGDYLATADDRGEILQWQVGSGRLLLRCCDRPHQIHALAFSPLGRFLVSGGDDGQVRLWNLASGDCLTRWAGEEEGGIRCLSFSPDGQLIASGSECGVIRIWHIHSERCLHRLVVDNPDMLSDLEENRIHSLAFSPDGNTLYSLVEDRTIRRWNLQDGSEQQVCRGIAPFLYGLVAVTPAGRAIAATTATTAEEQFIYLWDLETRQRFHRLRGHQEEVMRLAIVALPHDHASDLEPVPATNTPDACSWTAPEMSPELLPELIADLNPTIPQTTGEADQPVTAPWNALLASSSVDGVIKLWDVQSGQCLKTLETGDGQTWSLAFSPQGNLLASGSTDQTLRLWESQTGHSLHTLKTHRCQAYALAFSPDSSILASGNDDHSIRLWDRTGRCLKTLQEHQDWVCAIAFSPDARFLASGSDDHTVKLWDIAAGECLATFREHREAVRAMVYNASGDLLATASEDGVVKLWHTRLLRRVAHLDAHPHPISAIAFSPDGTLLASGSYGHTIHLWEVQSRTLRHTLQGCQTELLGTLRHRTRILRFHPDGQYLLSGSNDRRILLWHLAAGTCEQQWQIPLPDLFAVEFLGETASPRPIVIGSEGQVLSMWDLETGAAIAHLKGHTSDIWLARISPDHQLLVSASQDGEIRLWDWQRQVCLRTLRTDRPYEGMNITGATGISAIQRETLKVLGAVEY